MLPIFFDSPSPWVQIFKHAGSFQVLSVHVPRQGCDLSTGMQRPYEVQVSAVEELSKRQHMLCTPGDSLQGTLSVPREAVEVPLGK